jgi:DNA-binding transcriptional LysR family regulator
MAIAVKGTLLLNDLLAVRDAAIAGLGLAQLPACLTMPHVHAGRLVPVLLDYVPPPTPLFIQYSARKLQPARVRVFVEFMLERLRRNPDLTFDPRRKPTKKSATATRPRPSD